MYSYIIYLHTGTVIHLIYIALSPYSIWHISFILSHIALYTVPLCSDSSFTQLTPSHSLTHSLSYTLLPLMHSLFTHPLIHSLSHTSLKFLLHHHLSLSTHTSLIFCTALYIAQHSFFLLSLHCFCSSHSQTLTNWKLHFQDSIYSYNKR